MGANMTLSSYLLQNLPQTVMISLSIDEKENFQYNYWNWISQSNQLHLLKDDYSIGHIIHNGNINDLPDGGVALSSDHHPKNIVLNLYFGGLIK
jgi:hypothetical protein